MQHLEELQPKRHIDIDTKAPARNYLDRVHGTVSMKNQAEEHVKQEFKRIEKSSGSRQPQNYEGNPETSVEPKGKRGGAKGSQKPRHVKQMERDMRREIERGFQEPEESNLNNTDAAILQTKQIKTVAK